MNINVTKTLSEVIIVQLNFFCIYLEIICFQNTREKMNLMFTLLVTLIVVIALKINFAAAYQDCTSK